jgi:tetratricopeptide (TPR) repeat protein
MIGRAALALVLATCIFSERASAQTSEAGQDIYARGIAHYKLGELREAITDFKSAYAVKPTPALLFNLAQAYRRVGEPEAALVFYRSFVSAAPPSLARDDAKRRIEELSAASSKDDAPPAPPPVVAAPPPVVSAAPPSEPPPRIASSSNARRAGAIALVASTAAVGVVLLATATGLAVHAQQIDHELGAPSQGAAWSVAEQDRLDDGRASSQGATALYVLGAGALAASVVSAVVCRRVLRREPGARARLERGLRWTF